MFVRVIKNIWLVVYLPLWKMSASVGIIIPYPKDPCMEYLPTLGLF